VLNFLGVSVRVVRKRIGEGRRLLIKIGYFDTESETKQFVKKRLEDIDAYSAINTISVQPVNDDPQCTPALPGRETGGMCGRAIHPFAVEAVERLASVRAQLHLAYKIVGIGGILCAEDAQQMFNAGADAIECAQVPWSIPGWRVKYRDLCPRR